MTVSAAIRRELKATEKIILSDLTDLVFTFDMQEYQQVQTGQFIPVDTTECVRTFLNIRHHIHHRNDLLAAGK